MKGIKERSVFAFAFLYVILRMPRLIGYEDLLINTFSENVDSVFTLTSHLEMSLGIA